MPGTRRSCFFLLFATTLLLVLSFPGPSAAQQIQGRVAGDPDLYPVAGATIRLEGTNFQAMSDSLGTFSFLGIPAGPYLLMADHPSYKPVRDSVEVAGVEGEEWLVVMVPEPFMLEGIEARGISAAERRQRGSAAAHYVVLAHDDLEAYQDRGVARIGDLVWTHPRLSRWIRHDLSGGGVTSGDVCLQYPRPGARSLNTGTAFGEPECRFPAIYLDGAFIPDMGFIENLSPGELQSFELMPPSEASYRFGRQAENGALVVTTMMGAAESAARSAAVSRDQRRHLTYLGVGTAGGIFGSLLYASGQGLFDGGVSFNGDVLPVAGIVALGVALGEVFFRIFR